MCNLILLNSSGFKLVRLGLMVVLGWALVMLIDPQIQVAYADSGGPDGFGYIYKDSDEPDGPDFDFVDISASGTSVSLSDDDSAGPFAVGFDFPFYGNTQTEFYVGSNGFLSFGSGSSDLGNDCPLPSTEVPHNFIAMMWDDLNPGSGGSIYRQSFGVCPYGVGACQIVMFDNVPHYGGGTAGVFEAILFENGDTLIQFQDAGAEQGGGSTTGIENDSGTVGLSYGSCQTTGSITDGLAICFQYPGAPSCGGGVTLSKNVTPSTEVDYHGIVTYTIVLENSGTLSETNGLLTDTLPSQVDFGTWVEQPAGATVLSDEITWNGTLTIGTIITFTFTANHVGDYSDVVANTAEYSGTSVAHDTATFGVIGPDLVITKTVDPAVAIPGQIITYTLTFLNIGPISATGVIITDVVPVSVTVQSVISSGIVITDSGTISPYVWNVHTLAQGEGGIITVTAVPLATGRFTNTVSCISTTPPDVDTTNNASSAGVTVGNMAPIAVDDLIITDEDTTVSIHALNNDTDPDNDTLRIDAVGTPNSGIVAISDPSSLVYTPTFNFYGIDAFTYTASDNILSDTATITVTVRSVNDPPTATNDAITTTEDSAVSIPVLENDSDVEGDSLFVSGVGSAANGALATDGVGVVYTPAPDFYGSDSFTYTVGDSGGASDVGSVSVIVTAVNDTPNAVNDAATTDEEAAIEILVLSNDSDPENDSLTISRISSPVHGTATISSTQYLVYTPTTDYYGSDSFNYTISDGNGGQDTATVVVTVNPLNDAPLAVDDAAFTEANTAVVVDLLANDSDVDGDSLSIVSVTQGSNGHVSDGGDGSVVYAPDNGFSGLDAFAYTVSDGAGGSDTASVTIIVGGGQGNVAANDDVATTDEDTPTSIAVLANDSASDSSPLAILTATSPEHGIVAISNAQYLIYTPHADYYGPDGFTYVVGDGAQSADTAGVSLYVDPVNDNPDAVDDAAATDEDTAVNIAVSDNDADVDGDTIRVIGLGAPAHGSVRLLPDGDLRYTPAANYNGADSFTYTTGDGQGGEDSATVWVSVSPINDAPALVDDTVATDEDTPVDINVLSNDSDLEGDSLTVTALGAARNGTVVTNTDSTIRYIPDADYNGQDDFSYTTEDGNGGSNSAMVTIIIEPVDDPPEGVRDATIVTPSTVVYRSLVSSGKPGFSIAATAAATTEVELDVLSNDVNKDKAQLEVARVGRARNGRVTIGQGGKIKYTPDVGFAQGTDVFTYVVGAVGTTYESIEQVSIVYNPDSGDVVAVDDAIATDEDAPVTFSILDNDQNNVGGTSLALLGIIPGDKGLIVPNPDDTLTYYPAKNLNGTEVLTYVVGNGEMGGDYGEVTITINPVNDPPDAVSDLVTTTQGVSVTFDALANDEDVDGDALHVASVIPSGNGSVTINPDDTLTYEANPDFRGLDLFAVVVRDEHGRDDIGIVAVVVIPINNAPQPGIDLFTIPEDTPVTIPVLLNDFDEDGDVLTVIRVVQGSFGTVALNADNSVTYTPDANYNGQDSFGYTASDGDLSARGEVHITILPVNDPPNPAADTVNTPTDTPRFIFVLGNDADPEGNPTSISAVGTPAHGSVAISNYQALFSLLYTPTQAFSGIDVFTYTISDGELGQSGTVTVTVGVSNTAPTPSDDAVVTTEDNATTIAVLADDNDPDGDSLVVSGVGPATNGIVTISNNQVLVYRPDPDFYGSDTFTYTVSDGALSSVAAVVVTVTPLDDPPTAMDDRATTAKNTPVVVNVLLNDVDVDGDLVNVKAVGSANYGLVTLPPDPGHPLKSKNVTYTPAQDFVGTDVFTYTATDGAFDDTATVTVTVHSSGLIITKSVNTIHGTAQLPVLPGSVVTYTIQLAHAGGDSAQSVTLFDVLPAGVQFGEWVEGGQWGTLLLPDTILWGPHDVATGADVILRFTVVVATDHDFYGQTIVNVAQYSSENAGYGSDDARFEIKAAPSADINFVSPSAGQLFTATDNVSATVPITVATTNFTIPDDGHWQLWVNGNDLGTVYGYTTTATLGLGMHVISAELRDLGHAPLGPVAAVTVTIRPRVPFIYLPLVVRNRP